MMPPTPSRPSEVKAWCAKNEFRPNRTLGQNFLIDQNTIDYVAQCANTKNNDRILEIGPGIGAITNALMECGAEVTAVEKDRTLAELLKSTVAAQHGKLCVINRDALDLSLDTFLMTGRAEQECQISTDCKTPYFHALISNLPYSVGTRILLEICKHDLAPEKCVVMLQKEVAERIAALPSTKQRGLASIRIQQNYDVTSLKIVKPTCFWPKPEISSMVIRLDRHNRFPLDKRQRQVFESITSLAFMHRRKQMGTIFKQAALPVLRQEHDIVDWLKKANLDPRVRPEDITNEEWRTLSCDLATKREK